MPQTIAIHRLEQARAAANECVHFGFCTAVCPTYVLDAQENDSPRGRIALAREMLSSSEPPSEAAVRHLDRCLSCLSCQTTCAAGVDYREVIDAAREHIERSGVRPWRERVFRSFLARMLTSPRSLGLALRVATPLARWMGRVPGPVGRLAAMAAAPALGMLAARKAGAQPASPAEASGSEAGMLPAARRRMLLLTGCVQSVMGAEINAAAERLLRRAGITPVPTSAQDCCGALDFHMGRADVARQRAAARVREWSSALASGDIEAIVSTTSGCASVISHYDQMLSNQPELAAGIERVKAAMRDVTEVVQGLDCKPTGAARGAVVSYHDSCSMKHGLKLERPPRKALRKAGLDVRDIAESHLCCGSAGTYNILQPEIAEQLGRRKAGHATAARPDVIAAGNLGCLVQISRFCDTPVAHTVQLLDWATGGPPPRGLEGYVPGEAPCVEAGEAVVVAAAATADALTAAMAQSSETDPLW